MDTWRWKDTSTAGQTRHYFNHHQQQSWMNWMSRHTQIFHNLHYTRPTQLLRRFLEHTSLHIKRRYIFWMMSNLSTAEDKMHYTGIPRHRYEAIVSRKASSSLLWSYRISTCCCTTAGRGCPVMAESSQRMLPSPAERNRWDLLASKLWYCVS